MALPAFGNGLAFDLFRQSPDSKPGPQGNHQNVTDLEDASTTWQTVSVDWINSQTFMGDKQRKNVMLQNFKGSYTLKQFHKLPWTG